MARLRREVFWSVDADRDLLLIWAFLATEASPDIADKKLRDIHHACRFLERNSLPGRPRDGLVPGMRSILAHPYVVFFRVAAAGVEVVRVLHQRQDLDAIFGDGDC
jgi:toxin ParE1/3/4